MHLQAIDHTTHVLSLTHNKSSPIIFNTYQAYLKGSFQRLAEDMERARREKYVFAAKLVSDMRVVDMMAHGPLASLCARSPELACHEDAVMAQDSRAAWLV
jgi:hypothetical protein